MSSLKVGCFRPGSIVSPMPEISLKYNCRVKYYPDNVVKIACFSRSIFNPDKVEKTKKESIEEPIFDYDMENGTVSYKFVQGKTIYNPFTNEYEPLINFPADETIATESQKAKKATRNDSIKRTIDKAFEIGCANDFRYFVTLTINKEKLNRYEPSEIYPALKNWLSNRVSRNNMDYIIFPEYHKQKENETSPAIHFHGLVNGNFPLTDSGKTTEKGQVIYNLDSWKYGFSTVIELDGSAAVYFYVTKYITKENTRIFGKSYFSGGKTLKRELPTEYLNYDYYSFEGEEYLITVANMGVKYKTLYLNDL